MDSDNVNSISDTIESTQVATIIRDVYYDIVTSHSYADKEVTFQLTGLADTTQPTRMQLPTNISELRTVKYNKIQLGGTTQVFKEVIYLSPTDFLIQVLSRDSSSSEVTTVTDSLSSIKYYVLNNVAPTYWTTFDDEYIIFDSHDSDVDSSLQSSKTICTGMQDPANVAISDTLVFDLPSHLFPLLLAEAKTTCFAQVKQAPDIKSEQWAKKLRIKAQRDNRINKQGRAEFEGQDYGRK